MQHPPLWFWLVLCLFPLAVYGQSPFILSASQFGNGQAIELDKLDWKYSPNDDPRFADPQFDDSAWETLNGTTITLNSLPKSGWHGVGWFRLRLKVDPALVNQPLALVMVHYGASEVYLDGKLIERYGAVGATPESEVAYNPNTVPLGIALDWHDEHVIAVRHSCMALQDATSWWSRWILRLADRKIMSAMTNRTIEYGAGFGIRVEDLKQARAKTDMQKSLNGAGFSLFTCGLALAIGLLHLLLYWFYPNQRANLFFGVGTCFWSVLSIIPYLLATGHYGASGISILWSLYSFSFYSMVVFILAFFYAVLLPRLPKLFGLWIIAAAAAYFLVFFGLLQSSWLIFFVLVQVEVLRVVIQVIRNKVDGAWIIGSGLLLAATFGVFGGTYTLTGASIPLTLSITTAFAVALPPSIFLARRFARTNQDLETQLAQVKQLSAAALEHEKVKAENERRAKELEEARQLQLSMLPKKLPSLPHLDIAAYMKTASEVGGDYYDFHLTEDGTLTIAVGDATGHGLKAGTLVSSVKSLFVSLAYHPDISHIFHRMSRVLKEMKLRGLFMAMTMVKVKDHQMSVSIAGMPSVLIYRALNRAVEEVVMRALPLGGMTKYEYKQCELTLAPNDVVVLMSDGLPERFNPHEEMLDYARIFKMLPAIAQQSAEEIIARLTAMGDEWSEGRPQDDDVTFVVMKVEF